MEDRFYTIVHEKPYNHLEEEAFLKENDPELFLQLQERAAALPRELVREYGLDCVLYFLKREGTEKRELIEEDEDALCGIFRFLGRVYRAFTAPGPEKREGGPPVSAAEDAPGMPSERFYALCGDAFHALSTGRIHLYEADMAKALSFIQKGRGERAERKLFLLLLRESVPCLARHLLALEGNDPETDLHAARSLLEEGKAGSEAVVQVMGRVRGRLLVRPDEYPEAVIRRGEGLLQEAGLDTSGLRVKYIPGKVISFWK